jgi:hypothetical protein
MNHVYDVLAPYLGIGSAIALSLVVVFLLLSPLRRKFWIILAYAAWELFATAALTLADVAFHGSSTMGQAQTAANKLYARLYWTNDVLVDLFRFVLVMVLIYKASGDATKRVSGRVLTGLVVAMMILPFVLFHPTFRPFPRAAWFNSTSELLNFGAALMNLMLWGTLIASRSRDEKILMVSAGLGIVVTGTALSYGLNFLMGQGGFGPVGYLFMNVTQLAGWAVWCWAFRPAGAGKSTPKPLAEQSIENLNPTNSK